METRKKQTRIKCMCVYTDVNEYIYTARMPVPEKTKEKQLLHSSASFVPHPPPHSHRPKVQPIHSLHAILEWNSCPAAGITQPCHVQRCCVLGCKCGQLTVFQNASTPTFQQRSQTPMTFKTKLWAHANPVRLVSLACHCQPTQQHLGWTPSFQNNDSTQLSFHMLAVAVCSTRHRPTRLICEQYSWIASRQVQLHFRALKKQYKEEKPSCLPHRTCMSVCVRKRMSVVVHVCMCARLCLLVCVNMLLVQTHAFVSNDVGCCDACCPLLERQTSGESTYARHRH